LDIIEVEKKKWEGKKREREREEEKRKKSRYGATNETLTYLFIINNNVKTAPLGPRVIRYNKQT